MAPATTRGKKAALEALAARRKQYKNRKTVKNESLPAGSPMYFECITCRADIVVHEGYTSRPKLCEECEALSALGWLE